MLEHLELMYLAGYIVMKREGEDWSRRIKLEVGWNRGAREGIWRGTNNIKGHLRDHMKT